ncbi:hypothetical protein CR513_23516, partial [Mucuna pruriens]
MARTMLCENSLLKHLWAKAGNIACYVQNKILIIPMLNNTPHEIWRERRLNISYFHPFGCECLLLNMKDQVGKFDFKVDRGIFLGYSDTFKAYRVFNSRTLVLEESIHVKFNDGLTLDKRLSYLQDNFAHLQIGLFDKVVNTIEPGDAFESIDFITYHPQDLILRERIEGVKPYHLLEMKHHMPLNKLDEDEKVIRNKRKVTCTRLDLKLLEYLFLLFHKNIKLFQMDLKARLGDRIERKSTSRGCHFIGPCLIS